MTPRYVRTFLIFGAKLLGIIILTFIIFHLSPVDPARAKLGAMASIEEVSAERQRLGLDDPLVVQVSTYTKNIFTGNLGSSFRSDQPALPLTIRKGLTTGKILAGVGILSLVSAYLLTLLIHFQPAYRKPIVSATKALASLPSFVTAVGGLLLLFSLLDDVSTSDSLWIPILVLTPFPMVALTNIALNAIGNDDTNLHLRTSRSLNYPELQVFHRSKFRKALLPVLTAWTTYMSQALFPAMIIEIIMTVDGLGNLLANAVQQQDLPVIRAVILVNALGFLLLLQALKNLSPLIDSRLSSHS